MRKILETFSLFGAGFLDGADVFGGHVWCGFAALGVVGCWYLYYGIRHALEWV